MHHEAPKLESKHDPKETTHQNLTAHKIHINWDDEYQSFIDFKQYIDAIDNVQCKQGLLQALNNESLYKKWKQNKVNDEYIKAILQALAKAQDFDISICDQTRQIIQVQFKIDPLTIYVYAGILLAMKVMISIDRFCKISSQLKGDRNESKSVQRYCT